MLALNLERCPSQPVPVNPPMNGWTIKEYREPEPIEDPHVDADCSICMTIMVEPCRFKCAFHHFCIQCTLQMQAAKKLICPLCRYIASDCTRIRVDQKQQLKIIEQEGERFYKQYFLMKSLGLLKDEFHSIEITIGNKIQKSKNIIALNGYRSETTFNIWNAYVKFEIGLRAQDYWLLIDKVVFDLRKSTNSIREDRQELKPIFGIKQTVRKSKQG